MNYEQRVLDAAADLRRGIAEYKRLDKAACLASEKSREANQARDTQYHKLEVLRGAVTDAAQYGLWNSPRGRFAS